MPKEKSAKSDATESHPAPDVASAPGDCFDLLEAARIVASCIRGPYAANTPLRDVGIATAEQCTLFKKCIADMVAARGCRIRQSKIPCSADTPLHVVTDAVWEHSTL